MADHGFDVVDLHYAFRRHTHHRAADGIHWDGIVHRAITNLLLFHICEAWHVKVPASNGASNSPPQHQQIASVMHLDNFASGFGRQQTQRPVPRDANNDAFLRYGRCLEQNCHQNNWNNYSSHHRQFGNNMTNGGRAYEQRATMGLRNYRSRPY